ncbi:hypothetical protein FE257_009447 [Aspergillus nanangensis]|uniref:N-acetylgalactosaminide beta-1,3-galactosyltransferase n=1 Tax=Aspergillus nanangensis TaxID=2582783 RepID=A0AAD4CK05_ASPNN|nr:hypothetical protein FE257_009447 [Aspergillus nanangensis]
MSRMVSGRVLGSAAVLSIVIFALLFFIRPPRFSSPDEGLFLPDATPKAQITPTATTTTPVTAAVSSHESTIPSSATVITTTITTTTTANPTCDVIPALDQIQVIVKSGSNILYDKLPTQLLTTLQCYHDILLLADSEQDLGPYHVHDVLANVNATIKATHPDFEYYRTIQQYQQDGLDLRLLRDTPTSKKAAWTLDKYKFIHMLDQTWKQRPGREWYVFIEADTYLVLRNLALWLKRMDPAEAIYLGSAASYKSEAFAHGGSGIILSRAAMARVLDDDPGLTERYDQLLQHEVYGDYVFMKALKEKGVALQNSWPMLQGEKQNSLPFGPGPGSGRRHWCQPLVTMHGVTPGDVSGMWNFEQQRGRPEVSFVPFSLGEMYEHFMGQDLPSERDDWHNLSDDVIFRAPGVEGSRQIPAEKMTDVQKTAYGSFEQCHLACDEDPRCFQYLYDSMEQTCGFSYSYRLGARRVAENQHRYKSGWMREKIQKDVMENSCSGPEWV